jgi:UDP-N-acetylmuramoylalanine--D-glutamate ligase
LRLAVAAVLNISPDHLDRHGSMPRYHQAKHRIFRGCARAVVNRDDPLTIPLAGPETAIVSWRMGTPELGGFGLTQVDGREYLCHGFEPVLATAELGLAGRHNVANALAAIALGYSAGLPVAGMAASLRNFTGLPHRCQRLAEIDGVWYVDDSKGTNVGATNAALEGLGGDRNVVLIAGGQGKGADFTQLQAAVARHCKLLVLIGEDGPQLQRALDQHAEVTLAAGMDEAVALAAARAVPGDCVLLSPACASFDMFSGYAQRGDAFARAVQQIREERS